jgi:hypothetical protein
MIAVLEPVRALLRDIEEDDLIPDLQERAQEIRLHVDREIEHLQTGRR